MAVDLRRSFFPRKFAKWNRNASDRMPRRRRHLAGLSNLFDKTAQPIYVLDAQWRIVYANRACLEWVACEEPELLGRRCLF
ncbi:MAG: hypothetical protein D6741_04915, partial [Planctomycetota bacterium]